MLYRNFQQTIIHSPTKFVSITFTQREKLHNPPVQEITQSMCTNKRKTKQAQYQEGANSSGANWKCTRQMLLFLAETMTDTETQHIEI